MVNNNFFGVICGKIAHSFLFWVFVLFCTPVFAQQKGSGGAVADTFKLADKFLAKHKFKKAARLYKTYHNNHPKDVNAVWKLAQVNLWRSRNNQSDAAYKEALKLDPRNDNLNLNYIHSLLDMGKLGEAGARLTDMELAGKDYPNMAQLRARLNYYKGDFKQAAAYMRKDLNAERNNPESNELNDLIELARSPLISLQAAYLTDDQPLSALITTVKAENYFSRYATLYITADEYHFTQNRIADAPWVRVGDKLFFSEAGLHMNIGAGILKFPVKNTTGWSGNLALNKRISAHFDGDLSLDHVPYLDTRSSVDSNISATRVAAMLNWHMAGWSAQAAFLNSTYEDNNNVYGAYAWIMAPIVRFKGGQLEGGYSTSYSNSSENSFKPVLTLNEILNVYSPEYKIGGVYNPYFTPNHQFINSALVSLSLNPSKMVSINLGGDVGYGTINNPYLSLDKNIYGRDTIVRGFSVENFIPVNVTAAMNFKLDRTWILSARYVYHSTYFFTSNYFSLGIQKSFQHPGKKHAGETASTFSRLIKELEGRIQELYSCKSPEELKSAVSKIRAQLATLRDSQKNKEVLPDSDEAATLQEHYDGLDDMINEIDAVNLDDYNGDGGKKDKKQWLVRKQYELTSVSYEGNLRD